MRRARERHEDRERASHRATVAWAIRIGVVACLAGCRAEVAEVDGAFYDGDGRAVHCAINLDAAADNTVASVDAALDRAVSRGEVVELYAHKPGVTVTLAKLEHVLAAARDRGLAFVTYADFAAGTDVRPGLALSFDDSGVPNWMSARPLFQQYGARVTFFVTRYGVFSDDYRAQLRVLADDGHDIAAHSVAHLRAPSYVEENGVQAYLDDEAVPSIEVLRRDGYAVTAFAYPFGARTSELDDALLAHVPVLRSVSFSLQGAVSPCPH